MKKFGLLLLAVAMVAFCVATSQAGLVSLYTFDDTVDNAVSGAAAASLVGTASYTAGAVGSKAVSTGGIANYVDASGISSTLSASMGAFSIGYWVNTSVTADKAVLCASSSAGEDTLSASIAVADGMPTYFFLRPNAGGYSVPGGTSATSLANGAWHHVVMTWKQATSSTPQAATFYIDGTPSTTSFAWGDTMTSSATWSSFSHVAIGASSRDGAVASSETWTSGKIDDIGIWNQILTATQAKTLNNLGVSTLDYNAKDAQALFDVVSGGDAKSTSDGKTWYKVAGLAGAAGSVTQSGADWTVQLDGGLGASTVPEPGTLGLLLAGAMGLLVFAWRKRK